MGTRPASGRAQPRAGRSPRAPGVRARAATIGISQIRNCGESTFPSAMNAQSAAALERTSASRVPAPRANDSPDPEQHYDLHDRGHDGKDARSCAGDVLRPVARLTCEPEAEDVVRREQERRSEALDLQRPAQLDADAVPDTAAARGRRTAGRPPRRRRVTSARQVSASRRPARFQTYATPSGTKTAG